VVHPFFFPQRTKFSYKVLIWFLGLGTLSGLERGYAQNFTSYFSGNPNNIQRIPLGGVCMMGGATENDSAMTWFLRQANGGDLVVLRASGSNGYNAYMLGLPGTSLNSVESIVCNNAASGDDTGIIRRIEGAEALWFAGGDQYDYVTYWRNKAVGRAIQRAILQRNVPVGGTSAGMAILGEFYFAARNGTLSSANALANPFHYQVTVDSETFLGIPAMTSIITDTHFDNPDRRGRLAVMLARIRNDYGIWAKAIACDESTAVCLDSSGWARVYGDDPGGNDKAWFVQSNCELPLRDPENCTAGSPLNWNRGGSALRVAMLAGTPNGNNRFYLGDWRSVQGSATWYRWSVVQGQFLQANSSVLNCTSGTGYQEGAKPRFRLYPNPAGFHVFFEILENLGADEVHLTARNNLGQVIRQIQIPKDLTCIPLSTQDWGTGLVQLTLHSNSGKMWSEWLHLNPDKTFY